MMKTDIRPSYYASKMTPFMNTTSKCLRLFYWFLGNAEDTIQVSATDEELHETDVFRITGSKSSYWVPAFVALPDGVNFITIRGIRGNGNSGIAIDDIEIAECASFEGNEHNQRKTLKFLRHRRETVPRIPTRNRIHGDTKFLPTWETM